MKIAVYGGAFNPPHIEHLSIVKNAINELDLTTVIIVPSYNAPHKDINTPYNMRVKMLKILFNNKPNVIIEEIESKTGKEYNYAIDVLELLTIKYGELTYIIGGDSLICLHKWNRYEQLLKNYKLTVVPRYKDLEKVKILIERYKIDYNADITLLQYIGEDISSQKVRAKLMLNAVKSYITESLKAFIVDNKLYSNHNDIIFKLFNNIDKSKVKHTKGVIYKAIELNTYLGLSYDKVFLAALLHDCAKGCSYKEYIRDKNTFNNDINDQDFINMFGCIMPDDAILSPVEHQFLGAYVAYMEYNIKDYDILMAIRYHTTSTANHTLLGKLIYVADMLENNRTFLGVEQLRELSIESFNQCYKQCVIHSYKYLLNNSKDIYYLTKQAYDEVND